MDLTPNTDSKRSRAKVVVKEPTAKTARKTLSTSRKKSQDLAQAPGSNDLQARIQTMAFYLAAERHFEPGHELDDWLEAERRVKAQVPGA